MSEYNRFVSYIYVYENNQKTLNNGFVRVETLDGRCMVYIHMKDLYGGPQTAFDVYMVRRQQGRLLGIGLGTMKRDGSQGEFYHETQKGSIENSGISLDEMAGIVIVGGRGQKYGTSWDDDLLDMRRFEVYNPEEKQGNASPQIEDVVHFEPQFVSAPASEMEIVAEVENNAILEDNAISADNAISELKPAADMEQFAVPAAEDKETIHSESFEMEPNVSLSEAALTAAPLMGNMAGKKLSLEEKLDKILAQGMKMYPFEDDRVVSCIRFELQDIGMMPMKFASYVSNSFLLHNYYSYRHLIIGKFGDGKFFLGVPGMGQQKDRFMAQLFGFTEFKAIRESENGQSDFGYWYVILN